MFATLFQGRSSEAAEKLHNSCTAENRHIIHNKNSVIQNLYYPLRKDVGWQIRLRS